MREALQKGPAEAPSGPVAPRREPARAIPSPWPFPVSSDPDRPGQLVRNVYIPPPRRGDRS